MSASGIKNKFFDLVPFGSAQGPNKDSDKSPNFTSKYLLGHYQKIKELDKDLGRLPSKEEFFSCRQMVLLMRLRSYPLLPATIRSKNCLPVPTVLVGEPLKLW